MSGQKLFFLSYIFISFIYLSRQDCTPDDEFFDDSIVIKWDEFMEKLNNLTKEERVISCKNSNENVVINSTSDITWKLRFELYKEVQPEMDNCYSAQNGTDPCNQSLFQECMTKAREPMYIKLEDSTWWEAEIQNMIEC